jgi:hypothetical protein
MNAVPPRYVVARTSVRVAFFFWALSAWCLPEGHLARTFALGRYRQVRGTYIEACVPETTRDGAESPPTAPGS